MYNMENIYNSSPKLKLPGFCYTQIDSIDSMLNPELIKQVLVKMGIMIFSLKYDDSDGLAMEKIVNAIGIPHTHDTNGRVIWDIKQGGSNGSEQLARSHKDSEFVIHTDCSYELNIPDFFGLQIIQHDQMGGGKNLFVDGQTLIQHLSDKSFETLQNEKVKINVPPEFKKDEDHIHATVIDADFNVRFRKEIIDLASISDDMKLALNEFEQLCYSPDLNRSLFVEKNSIMIIDNKRFLHARTQIKDPSRHLKRIRFFGDFHTLS